MKLGDIYPHLRLDPKYREAAEQEAPPRPDPARWVETPVPAPRFDRDGWLRLKSLVEACPHRGGPTSASCGCAGLRHCAAGKGRPVAGEPGRTDVTDADCRACVAV